MRKPLEKGIVAASEARKSFVSVIDGATQEPVIIRRRQRNAAVVLSMQGAARRVRITHRVHACHDPKDDTLLHVALNRNAEAIVSGGRDLSRLDPLHGVRIPSPAGFCQAS